MVTELVGGVEAKLTLDISEFTSAIETATKEAQGLGDALSSTKFNTNLESAIQETLNSIKGLKETVESLVKNINDSLKSVKSVLDSFNLTFKTNMEEAGASSKKFKDEVTTVNKSILESFSETDSGIASSTSKIIADIKKLAEETNLALNKFGYATNPSKLNALGTSAGYQKFLQSGLGVVPHNIQMPDYQVIKADKEFEKLYSNITMTVDAFKMLNVEQKTTLLSMSENINAVSSLLSRQMSQPLAELNKMWSGMLKSGVGADANNKPVATEIDKIISKNMELINSTKEFGIAFENVETGVIGGLTTATLQLEKFAEEYSNVFANISAMAKNKAGFGLTNFDKELVNLNNISAGLRKYGSEVDKTIAKNERLVTATKELEASFKLFGEGKLSIMGLQKEMESLKLSEEQIEVLNKRLGKSLIESFKEGELGITELIARMKELTLTDEQLADMNKLMEQTFKVAFDEGVISADKYIQSLKEIGMATEEVITQTKGLQTSMSSGGTLLGANSRSNSKNKGTGAGFGGVTERTFNLIKMMAMLDAFMGVWESTESYMESSSAIRGYYDILHKRDDKTRWNADDLVAYNNELSRLQGIYSKLNVREVGAEVMKMGQIYGLTAKETKDFTETALIFTDAMANEGRSARDSSLALKDLIDQGAGWSRRTQEVGITEDVLKAQKDKNGKAYWTGDKQDKEGLMKALASAEEQLHLDERAKQINTLEDGVNALYNSIGALAGGLLDIASPSLIQLFSDLSKVFFELNSHFVAWSSSFNALKETNPELYAKYVKFGEWAIAGAGLFLVVKRLSGAFSGFGGVLGGLGGKIGGLFKKVPKGGILGGILNGTKGGSTGGTGDVINETGGTARTLKSTLGNIKNNLLVEAEVFVSLVAGITMALATLWIASEELALVGQRYEQIRTNVQKGMTALRDYEKLIEDIYPMLIGFMATAGVLGAVTMATDGIGLVAIEIGLGILVGNILALIPTMKLVGNALADLGESIGGQKANFDKGCKALKEIGEMMGVLAVAVGEMAKADWNALSDNIANALAKLTGGDALQDVLKLADKFNGNDSNSFISQFNSKTKNIGKLNTESAKKFSETVKSIGEIFKGINNLNKALKEEPQNPSQLLDQRGSHLGEIISGINKFNWRFQQQIGKLTTSIDINKANNLIHSANAIKNINTAIRNLVKDMKADENIVDTGRFKISLTNLGTQVGVVSGFLARMGKYNSDAFSYNNFQSIVTSINNIKNISDSMQSLMGSFASDSVFGSIKRVLVGGTNDLGSALPKLAQQVSQIKTFVSQVNAYGIGNINVNLAPINTAINQVRSISNSMNNLTNTLTTSYDYTTLAYNLWTMGNAIREVKKFMDSVNSSGVGNTAKGNAIAGINELVTQLKKTLDEFATEVSSAEQQLYNDGETLGNSFKRGLNSTKSGTITTAKSIMTRAIETIRYYAQRFYQTGQYNGKRLDAGFKSGITKLGSTLKQKLDENIRTIRWYAQKFYQAGEKLGSSFRSGFLAGLGTIDVNSHINGTEDSRGGEYRKIQSFNLQSAMLKQANKNQAPSIKQTVIKSEKTTTQTEKTVEKDKSKEQAPVINISFEGAIINGSNEFRESIQQIAEEVMLNYLSPNPATGY